VTIRLLLCLAAAGTAVAQEEPAPPKAEPVNPALEGNAGQDWYERGKNLYDSAKATANEGQRKEIYGRAVEVLSGYLGQYANHPNADAASWYLGESHAALGKEESARKCYRDIVKRGGKSPFTMVAANRLAVEHYKKKEFAQAAPLYEQMAEAASTPGDRLKGRYFAAVAYDHVKDGNGKAAANYREVLADKSKDNSFRTASQLALGRILTNDGKLEEALPYLEEAAGAGSAAEVRGPAALQAAAVAAKLGKEDVSAKYLELVLKTPGMEGSRENARFALMAAHFDRKDFAKVLEIYKADPAAGTSEQDARRLMLAARSSYELKQYEEAARLFNEVEKHPAGGAWAYEASYLRLLSAYRGKGSHDMAEVDAFLNRYQKDHAEDPKIHTALLIKAEALLEAKKPEEAAKAYRAINAELVSGENRAGMLYNRARCLKEIGDLKGALKSFDDFIAGFPKEKRLPQALFSRALTHQAAGNTAKAVADFDALIASEGPDELKATAYFESGEILAKEGKLPEMIVRYRGFLEKFPKASSERRALANYRVAWALVKSEQVKEALPLAELSRELDPKTYAKPAGLMIAAGHYSLQDAKATGDEIDRAIKEGYDAELPPALVTWAGTQAFQAKGYERAATYLQMVADPKQAASTPKAVWRMLGKAQLETGNPEPALASLDHALAAEEHPTLKTEIMVEKGKALLALKRADEALAIAGEAQDLRPQGRANMEVRLLLGDAYMLKKDPAKANEAYVVAVTFADPNDRELTPLAYHHLARSLEAVGKTADAEKYRKELKEKFPEWKAPE
jgi:tetratricopeptide (TPR) repeat protein